MSEPFIRPGLGRRFGKLMEEAKPRPSTSEPGQSPPPLTPGVEALFRGSAKTSGADQAHSAAESTPEYRRRQGVVRWTLIAGDAVLLILAAWLVLGTGHPVKPAALVLAVIAVLMGAWLASLAFLHK